MDSESANTRFLTAIGHDLRQPLHALLLYLDALDRRIADDDARAVLGKADQAARALAGMIEGLIQMAKLDAGKFEPVAERVSLQDLFDDLIAASPQLSADPTSLHALSDPAVLYAIMQQLVSNAEKHGGGAVRLSADEKEGAIEIGVRDEGPGIAPADQARIFDEFVRLGGGATGLGVGLTIARKLTALLDHEIDVRSALGKGATFFVRVQRG